MKAKYILFSIITILLVSFFLTYGFLSGEDNTENTLDFYFGLDVAYADIEEIKELIDEVSPYTNLFLIGSTGISHNTTKLNEVCQYLYEKDLYFIIYDENPRHLNTLNEIENKWGDKFLGLEYEDEMGGYQLDLGKYRIVVEAENHSDAANQFVEGINMYLNLQLFPLYPLPSDFQLFTADYALYWFDYKAGYAVVLAEFGWNYSRQLNVALCRGAATIQNKEWGAMITWTYSHPPYIESGAELYQDLVYAYENGAKYILVFDSNKEYTEGILTEEHFEALEQFWEYVKANPRESSQSSDRVAYVLPKDYAYGFRGPNDKIWGLWEADALSFEISENLGKLMLEYGVNLDIIYDDGLELDGTYSKYIFWNGTIHTS
jgi:hypothetical protein